MPAARLFEEVLKILLCRDAVQNFRDLRHYGLIEQLFPETEAVLVGEDGAAYQEFIEKALGNTALRLVNDQPVSPAFLYAAVLWPAVARRFEQLMHEQGHPHSIAMTQAGNEVLARQLSRVAIPKRFGTPAREIWQLQPRFERRRGTRPKRMLGHPRFRAAYDFLLLRAEVGQAADELAQWWTEAQEGELPVVVEADEAAPARKRRRRRPRKRPAAS